MYFRHPPERQHYKTESGCRYGEKCVFMHREVDSQPNKQPKESDGKGSGLFIGEFHTQLGCVFQDIEPPKSYSILRKGTEPQREILKRVHYAT